jgi:LysM repeat protein
MGYKNKFELSPRLKLGVGRGYSQNQILKISSIICLIIAVGLSVNAVRLISHQSNLTNPKPQVLGATDIKEQSDTVGNQFTDYKVTKGDTLFNISQKFNISWATIASLNNLKSPFSIKPGQTLKIPKQ